eukprot:CCRYP_001159-RF/>CCRYP_001159-RF protein AED:0.48 eAED:0.48 QI:0/-1/0/1/-1/0/1/0/44
MDMRFHWLVGPHKSKTILFLLAPGHNKQGDYFTKHHPASHHRNM